MQILCLLFTLYNNLILYLFSRNGLYLQPVKDHISNPNGFVLGAFVSLALI